jgi:hypothetical protein
MGGNVDVDVFGAGDDRRIEISSMGGSIEITLPHDFAAEFEVVTQANTHEPMGKITSDFPLTISRSTRRSWFQKLNVLSATGTTGSGGAHIRIWTMGGDITIRKRFENHP